MIDLARRFLVRFVCLYLALYWFPAPLSSLPGLGVLDRLSASAWNALLPWAVTGGDSTGDYVRVFVIASFALCAALAWSIIDRGRAYHPRWFQWLHLSMRYVLAFALLGYGFVKVFKSQFPAPNYNQLMSTYGSSSPQKLLWVFMGYSTLYSTAAGIAEVAAGALLFCRRTATLGGLLAFAVMAHVTLLDFAYGLNIKLFALHLCLSAVFVVAPDLPRLADLLIFHRPVAAAPVPPASSLLLRRLSLLAKVLITGWAFYSSIKVGRADYLRWGDGAAKPAIAGIWEVEEFTRDGKPLPPLTTDKTRWRWVLIDRAWLTIVAMDDSQREFNTQYDNAGASITLTAQKDKSDRLVVSFQRVDEGTLILTGALAGRPITVRLRRHDASKLRLNQGFRWTSDPR